MKKIIAAINMTLDGFCDHTSIVPDEEMHEHYTLLLGEADTVLYGRITYQLMEYWRDVVNNPTGNEAMDQFATAMDRVPKLVFSHTLKHVDWESARLATRDMETELSELRQHPGKDIFVCSPGLIAALTDLHLIDEYQICLHPVIAGGGLPLFKNIRERIALELVKTKTLGFGAIILYYEKANQ